MLKFRKDEEINKPGINSYLVLYSAFFFTKSFKFGAKITDNMRFIDETITKIILKIEFNYWDLYYFNKNFIYY